MNWTSDLSAARPLPDMRPEILPHLSRDELLLEWMRASRELAAYKSKELLYRKAITAREFANCPEGTHYAELGNGYRIKAVVKFNYNLAEQKSVEEALDKIEEAGNEGKFIAERLVKWDARLSVSEWRKLDDKYKKLIAPVLTIKPGAPELELIEPKAAT